MNNNMKKYQRMGWKALNMLFVLCLTLAATASLTACSSDDDPYFTASESDYPRILNTDLTDQKINRKTNLVIEIKVTPMKYTTVTWLLDGTQIFEGSTLDQKLPLGDHVLKIVATTTQGKSTSRTINVTVTLTADDPMPGTDIHELLVKQGTTATLHGTNMSKVKKMHIGDREVAFTYYADGDYLEYTVPADMADGVYTLTLTNDEGEALNVGTIELNTNPEYPDQGGEMTLWEGTHAVDWGTIWEDADGSVTAKLKKEAKVGSVLRLYVNRTASDYCQLCPTVDWVNLITGTSGDDTRGDTPFDQEKVMEFKLTEISLQLLENGKLSVVGHGFDLLKITIE